jgi:hypothetical protein
MIYGKKRYNSTSERISMLARTIFKLYGVIIKCILLVPKGNILLGPCMHCPTDIQGNAGRIWQQILIGFVVLR